MAAHNRWTQIKRAKGAADARRGRLFPRPGRELMVAAGEGGGDPALNELIEQLDDHDGVKAVHHNADLPADI